jgi:hypothetical protein
MNKECGAMNEWLAVVPHAQIANAMTGCEVSLNDMADRPKTTRSCWL